VVGLERQRQEKEEKKGKMGWDGKALPKRMQHPQGKVGRVVSQGGEGAGLNPLEL